MRHVNLIEISIVMRLNSDLQLRVLTCVFLQLIHSIFFVNCLVH